MAGLQSEAVEAIVRSHIEEENTLIIACGKSDNDAQTMRLALAESPGVDPSGARTIRLRVSSGSRAPSSRRTFERHRGVGRQRDVAPHPRPRAAVRWTGRGGSLRGCARTCKALPLCPPLRRPARPAHPYVQGQPAEQLSEAATAVAHRLDAIGRSPLGESEPDQHDPDLPRKRAEAIVCQAASRRRSQRKHRAASLPGRLSRWSGDHIDELDIQYWTICELEPLTFKVRGR